VGKAGIRPVLESITKAWPFPQHATYTLRPVFPLVLSFTTSAPDPDADANDTAEDPDDDEQDELTLDRRAVRCSQHVRPVVPDPDEAFKRVSSVACVSLYDLSNAATTKGVWESGIDLVRWV